MKLLQWNVWIKEDPKKILKVIKSLNPDLMCLQELTISNNVNVAKYISDELGFYYFYKTAHKFDNSEQGNAIFSRFKLSNSDFVYVQEPKQDNDYSSEGRIALMSELEIDNIKISICTTHLSYTHKFIETEQKIQEEQKLLNFIQEKSNFIIAGDFNVGSNSKLIENLQKNFINLGPNLSENSWTTKPFKYDGFEENKLNWRLDHMWGISNIKKISSSFIKTEVSDHLPLLLEFEII